MKMEIFVGHPYGGSRFDELIQVFTPRYGTIKMYHIIGHEIAHGIVPRLQIKSGTVEEFQTFKNRAMALIEEWLCHVIGVPIAVWWYITNPHHTIHKEE